MTNYESLTYSELLKEFSDEFTKKVEKLEMKDIDDFFPYRTIREKLFYLLNLKLHSGKKLFNKDVKLGYAYVYKRFVKENKLDMYKVNMFFSPMKNVISDPRVLANLADGFIENELNASTSNVSRKEKEFYNILFSEEETPKFYEVKNDKNILLYCCSTFIDSKHYPEIIFKQLFLPVIFDRNISNELLLLPYDFYMDDYKEFLEEYQEKDMIVFNK